VEEKLKEGGFRIDRERLALSRNDARFFGTLDLQSAVAPGVTLAVGVRNSLDKSLPIGFAAGARVMVCDNLAFRSEITVRPQTHPVWVGSLRRSPLPAPS